MVIFDIAFLDELSKKARLSERLRASYDLRNTSKDKSQRVLNALEPGTIVPIHRHNKSTEVVSLLRGSIKLSLFNDDSTLQRSVIIDRTRGVYGYDLPIGVWHTAECLETGTIFLETKDGAYEPMSETDIMK